MKVNKWVGVLACLLLIVACFLPWTHYPVIDEPFTGFYVRKFPNGNYYGRPGYFLCVFALVIAFFTWLPKLWAKRTNLFLSAFLLAYVVRIYYLFTGSLFKGEVEVLFGLYLVLISAILIMLSSIFPDMKVSASSKSAPIR